MNALYASSVHPLSHPHGFSSEGNIATPYEYKRTTSPENINELNRQFNVLFQEYKTKILRIENAVKESTPESEYEVQRSFLNQSYRIANLNSYMLKKMVEMAKEIETMEDTPQRRELQNRLIVLRENITMAQNDIKGKIAKTIETLYELITKVLKLKPESISLSDLHVAEQRMWDLKDLISKNVDAYPNESALEKVGKVLSLLSDIKSQRITDLLER